MRVAKEEDGPRRNNSLSCASEPFTYATENFHWYTEDESTLLSSLAGGMLVLALCMLAYAALWRVSPFLRRAAFGAAVAPEEAPVPIIRTWRVLAGGTGYKRAIDEWGHLEDQLFFSFLRMHLNLFLTFSVIALPITCYPSTPCARPTTPRSCHRRPHRPHPPSLRTACSSAAA